ncbi:MAG: SPFH domain-containing protein, partial [Bacteroidota bacterium]
RYSLPLSENEMREIHTKYGSQRAVDQELVRTVIEKAVYMTGPLMSSKESSSEKRNDLLSYIEDQAKSGVYRTKVIETKEIDPLSGKEKTVAKTELVTDEGGLILRQDQSPLGRFGINIYNLSLNRIKYDETIEKQIAEQQNAIMRVQTSIAEAREAEQQAIKAEADGKPKPPEQEPNRKWKRSGK